MYVFDGPENWLKDQALHRLVEKLLPKEAKEFNLDPLDGRSCTAAQVVSAAQSLPWMTERRVVTVSSAEEISTADGKLIVEGLSDLPKSTCIVFIFEGKANLRDEIPAHVLSYGQSVTFWTPFPNQMPNWVMNEVRRYGKTMSFDAAALLADSCGDLQDIVNELNKITLFVGDKKNIDIADIQRHGLPDEAGDFKDLEEAMWTRNTTEALRQGELLSSSGVRPEMMFPVFERIFKNLILGQYFVAVKRESSLDVATKLGIRGKTNQENFQKGLRAYRRDETQTSLRKIVQADYDLKTGALSGPLAVTLLIWNLCGRGKEAPILRASVLR